MSTIKRKVEMNLPQLIEWAWDNKIRSKTYRSLGGAEIEFSEGDVVRVFRADSDDTFTVEVDEPITENTVFELMIEIIDGYQNCLWERASVEDWKDEDSKEFHAYIDGKFKLIWKNGKMVE